MTVEDAVIRMIEEKRNNPGPFTGESNLYTDLGFDSLAFITLLVNIEAVFHVAFDIAEMQDCLQVKALITSVERKLEEVDMKND